MRSNPERLAWRILVAAFGVFLVLCGSAAYAIWWFVFQSTVPLGTSVTVAQGTASIILSDTGEPLAVTTYRAELEKENGVSIRTNPTTQAVITFADPGTQQPVASVVIFQDSELSIRSARAPRFAFNQHPHQIELELTSGRIELLVFDALPRQSEVLVESPHLHAQNAGRGQYLIEVSSQSTRITAKSGEARIVTQDNGRTVNLQEHERTTVGEGADEMELAPAEISLLSNSNFEEPLDIGWSFYNDQWPPGRAYNSVVDGRTVVAIDRAQANYPDETLSHAETGLVQRSEIDVADYSTLSLRTTFFIAEQSLSTCGEKGSECPLMILIKFIDVNGIPREFRHGFFATYNPSYSWNLTCPSCNLLHERINLGSWYTYETPNLVIYLPEARPAVITEVSFYASGWAYKIYVAEMQLLARE